MSKSQVPVVKLRNVWKIYSMGEEKVNALQNASLEINKGDFVAIIGASGSGKSTMMNLVGCLDYPTRGQVFLDGKDIAKMSESALAQIRGKKVGFIFQQFNLIGTLTAEENVALPMVFQNLPADERKRRADELLKKVDLSNRKTHKPNELSGGQRQRVAVARALANKPEVILADEPTGNLDSKTGAELMGLLQALHKEGRTVILVTHDINLVKHAEKVVHLKDGRIDRIRRLKR